MFNTNYLTEKQLKGFKGYKYTSVDTSPLSYFVMEPFWNFVVKFCPRFVAPNVLTFTGFLLTSSSFLLLSFYDYYFFASSEEFPQHPPIPRWIWLVSGFNIFLAHTLDGIDGKHARKIGLSGPLGELFDHGLDSWTAVLLPTGIFSLFGRGQYSVPLPRLYAALWAVLFVFFATHWEKYLTGVLYLPWGNDVAYVILLFCYLLTYTAGQQVWLFYLPYSNLCSEVILEVTLWFIFLFTVVPVSSANVYKSYRDKTGKMLSLWEGLRPLWCLATLFSLFVSWAVYSPSDVLEKDPRCFFYVTGTIFSNITCRLIISQMTRTRCALWNWLFLPAAIIVVTSFCLSADNHIEVLLLRLLAALVTVAHIHYGVCVVRQLCRHFNIFCFSIRKK